MGVAQRQGQLPPLYTAISEVAYPHIDGRSQGSYFGATRRFDSAKKCVRLGGAARARDRERECPAHSLLPGRVGFCAAYFTGSASGVMRYRPTGHWRPRCDGPPCMQSTAARVSGHSEDGSDGTPPRATERRSELQCVRPVRLGTRRAASDHEPPNRRFVDGSRSGALRDGARSARASPVVPAAGSRGVRAAGRVDHEPIAPVEPSSEFRARAGVQPGGSKLVPSWVVQRPCIPQWPQRVVKLTDKTGFIRHRY